MSQYTEARMYKSLAVFFRMRKHIDEIFSGMGVTWDLTCICITFEYFIFFIVGSFVKLYLVCHILVQILSGSS